MAEQLYKELQMKKVIIMETLSPDNRLNVYVKVPTTEVVQLLIDGTHDFPRNKYVNLRSPYRPKS